MRIDLKNYEYEIAPPLSAVHSSMLRFFPALIWGLLNAALQINISYLWEYLAHLLDLKFMIGISFWTKAYQAGY